ncbi:hypothetical protein Daus18300_000276 [Diaporthe australafricana]|uniref:Uncharacterized protein n=1 Tax=Diaporthe australafricana TaxID=127596 RepID=A0ABR3Y597_9PEZI
MNDYTRKKEVFKIICQTDCDGLRSKSTIEPNYKVYDLLPITCRKRGVLQFEFDLNQTPRLNKGTTMMNEYLHPPPVVGQGVRLGLRDRLKMYMSLNYFAHV